MIDVNNKTRSRIDLVLVKKIVEEFLSHNKKKNKEVSVVFVGDKKIRYLNKVYRKIDKITDVLSFEGSNNFFGEIIIDYSQIKRQKKFSGSVKKELIFILIHGLLHLLGYNDETGGDAEKMEKLGEEFIKKLKIK